MCERAGSRERHALEKNRHSIRMDSVCMHQESHTGIRIKTKVNSMLRKLAIRGGAAAALGAGGGLGYLCWTDEGTARSVQFWRHILPVYAHYRTVQLLNRDLRVLSDEAAAPIYESLHEKYADEIRDLCYKMRCEREFKLPSYILLIIHKTYTGY